MMSGLRCSATCITFFLLYERPKCKCVYNIQCFKTSKDWQRKYARPTNPTGPRAKDYFFAAASFE